MAMTLSVFVIFKFATRFLKGSSSSSNSSTKNEVNGNCSSKKSSIASSSSGSSTSPNTVLSTQRTRSGRHVVHKKFSEDEILYWYFWYLGCFFTYVQKKRSFQIFYPKITILVSMLPICYIKLHVTYYLLFFVQQYLIIFFCSENIVLSNLKFHDILLTEFRCMYSKIKFRRNIKSMIFLNNIYWNL